MYVDWDFFTIFWVNIYSYIWRYCNSKTFFHEAEGEYGQKDLTSMKNTTLY